VRIECCLVQPDGFSYAAKRAQLCVAACGTIAFNRPTAPCCPAPAPAQTTDIVTCGCFGKSPAAAKAILASDVVTNNGEGHGAVRAGCLGSPFSASAHTPAYRVPAALLALA